MPGSTSPRKQRTSPNFFFIQRQCHYEIREPNPHVLAKKLSCSAEARPRHEGNTFARKLEPGETGVPRSADRRCPLPALSPNAAGNTLAILTALSEEGQPFMNHLENASGSVQGKSHRTDIPLINFHLTMPLHLHSICAVCDARSARPGT